MISARRIFRGALRRARVPHRRYVFRRVLKELGQHRDKEIPARAIRDVVYGWNNESWSALEEYAEACVRHARESDGPILECGSGLTTILLGLVADRTGQSVLSLEHSTHWAGRTSRYLDKCGIQSVNLWTRPLRDYGEFSWYDPPLNSMRERFTLVVCDGPPSETPGGRYGLLPVMREHLEPGCVILLDDWVREQERSIAARWAEEYGLTCEVRGEGKSYARIVVP